MTKRIVAFILTAVLLIPAAFPSSAAGYSSKQFAAYAEEIADVARDHGESYSFGDDKVSIDDLKVIMSIVYNEHPDMFCLDSGYKYSYGTDPVTKKKYVKSVLLEYSMSEKDYALAMADVNKWIDEVISLADPSFSEYEYALFFHDYLCSNYEYDTNHKVHNVYDFIKTGKGVCQAYTYAYMILLGRVGIETSWASSEEMNHLWTVVKIDGKWYHVDVTWDDPVGDVPGTAKHTYFLLSDKAISSEKNGHYGWVSPFDCKSDKYDANRISVSESSYAYLNNKWYYVKGGDLYSTDLPGKDGTLALKLEMKWLTWARIVSYYPRSYSSVLSYDGKLFVSSPDSILKVDPATGKATSVYNYTGNEGRVYGFKIDTGDDGISGAGLDNAKVLVHISKTPSDSGKYISAKLATVYNGGSGDASGDGKVNVNDAAMVMKYVAKWDISINAANADIDGNGTVNIADVGVILKKVAGWF